MHYTLRTLFPANAVPSVVQGLASLRWRARLFAWLVPFVFCANAAQAATVSSVAGGFYGDGQLATSASNFFIEALSKDAAGNIYVQDKTNRRIRKITASTGVISTIAGGGPDVDYPGDGTPAINAYLTIFSSAAHSNGDVYAAAFTRPGQRCIYKIAASTGLISTVPGSCGWVIDGLVVAPDGTLYFSVGKDNVVLTMSSAGGTVNRLAGNYTEGYSGDGGLAYETALNQPGGLALDPSASNLFIADRNNHRVRRVNLSTYLISTVAGNGSAAFAGDGGPASSASLNTPYGVAFDAAGNMYIGDAGNHRIRKVLASNASITTIAGNGVDASTGDGGAATAASLRTPMHLVVDGANNVFVADNSTLAGSLGQIDRLRKISGANGVISTVVGTGAAIGAFGGDGDGGGLSSGLNAPRGVAGEAYRSLYFSDQQNHRIRWLDTVTTPFTQLKTLAGNGVAGFAGDGGPASGAMLNSPAGMALTPSGASLYIADQLNHRVRKIDTITGVISTVAGNGLAGFSGDGGAGISAQLSSPSDVALDLAGNLFIADTGNHRIRKLNLVTGVMTTVAGNGSAGFAGDGQPAVASMLNAPAGIGVDLSGNIYVADTNNHRVRRVQVSHGTISTVAGDGGTSFGGDGRSALLASLSFPQDVLIDNGGDLYVSDSGHHRIRRIDGTTGLISTVIGNGVATFNGDYIEQSAISLRNPTALLITPKRNFVFTDTGNHRVRVIDGTFGYVVAGAPPVLSSAGTISSSAKLTLGTSSQDLVFTTPQVVGTSAPVRSVTLKNRELTQAITITSVQATGDFSTTSNCVRVVAADDTCEISLTFSPSAPGERSGTLTIVSDIGGFFESQYLTSGNGIATPGAPTLLSANPGNGQATLFFVPPQNDGASSIVNYIAGCGAFSASGVQSPVTVTGLTNGMSQSCAVRAQNAAGQGAFSNAISIVPGAAATVMLTLNIGGTGSGSVVSNPASLACTSSCSGNFSTGTSVVLTAAPSAGSSLANWSGCDFVNGVTCTVAALSGSRSVGVSFAPAPASPPLAPALVSVSPGNAQAVVRFVPGTGGTTALGFRATCQPDGVFALGLGSPLVVTGLTNNVTYSCSVRAENAIGVSANSAAANVTPASTAAPTLLAAASRFALAAPASRDLPIDLTQSVNGNPTIEPRLVSGAPIIVFQLSDAINAVGSGTATDSNMNSLAVSSMELDGNNILVRLPAGLDRKRVQVSISGINALAALLNVAVGYLAGDVTASGRVTAADIAALKAQSGRTLLPSNLQFDLNGDGQITSSDVNASKSRVGTMLP